MARSAREILDDAEHQPAPATQLERYLRRDGINLVAGPEGSGKSSLLGAIAGAVVGGVELPWAPTTPHGPVLWLSAEEDPRTVAEPFRGLPAEALQRIHIECGHALDLQQVMKLIRELKPILVVADPVDVLASPRQNPREQLQKLLDYIRDEGCIVVGVLHTLHGARPGGKLVKGSGDWTRLARSVLYYGPDPRHDDNAPERRSVLYHLKTNRGGERGPAQEFSETHGWLGTVEGLELQHIFARPEKKPTPGPVTSRAIELLKEWLTKGPMHASEVYQRAEEQGISRSTTDRAANVLEVMRVTRHDEETHQIQAHLWILLPAEDATEAAEPDVSGGPWGGRLGKALGSEGVPGVDPADDDDGDLYGDPRLCG